MVKVWGSWSLLVHDNGWSMGRHDGSSYEKKKYEAVTAPAQI